MRYSDITSEIFGVGVLEYKDFKIKYVEEAFDKFKIICIREPYVESTRDAHGVLSLTKHPEQKLEFFINHSECLLEECCVIDVVFNRFKAEVDYYLNNPSAVSAEDFIKNTFNIVKATN